MKNTKKLTMRLIAVRFLKVTDRKQILKLAAKNFLLPSVQYAMFCGWQRLIPEGIDIG